MDETRLAVLEKAGSTDVQELVAEVRRLRDIVIDANDVLFDTRPFDVEHSISCHADTLPQVLRESSTGHEKALSILQVVINEMVGG